MDPVKELNGFTVEQVIANAAKHGISLRPGEIDKDEFGVCTIDGDVWWSWVSDNSQVVIKEPMVILVPDDMPINVRTMLETTIKEFWTDFRGDKSNPEAFWNFLVSTGS